MGNENSAVTDKIDVVEKTEEASAPSKDADAGGSRRANVKTVQNVLLIWLDKNIDDNNEDCRNTISQLRRIMNEINTFVDGDQCIQFINTIDDNKVCIIISGSLGQQIVPQVHKMSQVDSIFIFCRNKTLHEEWTKEWSKIKGVYTNITHICEDLKQASQQCEQNAISISFVATSEDGTKKNLDRLDPMFMYTQIMKEILLTIKFEQKHFNEYIDYCRDAFEGNEDELKIVEQMRRNYRDKTPAWWYTYECFLYAMLNRALRISDVDIIIKMGFFIGDLHRQIEKLHREQFGSSKSGKPFIVYRGQGLSKTDFDQLTNTKGGLMSFNNFLSTSKDCIIALRFARNALTDPNSMGVFFSMTIDPSKSTAPFASITGVSCYKEKEEEVLFSMHTVFRIGGIKSMGEDNRLVQVDLTLTGENDKDLRALTDRIREETFPNSTGWYRLGLVLYKMGQFERAEQVYEAILQQTVDEVEKGNIYCLLGTFKRDQGEYKEAISCYEKSLEIYRKTFSPSHLNLAYCYNNIGAVYYAIGDYSKALSSHEKALEIKQKSLSPNHSDLAASYNNIGLVYYNTGDYSKALSSHEKAHTIQKQSLPSNHPDLAMSCSNIGNVYKKMGDHSKAHSFYERAVDIAQQSLPATHPDLEGYKNNLKHVEKKS
jgi:Tfp pilus assembly protein PilF